MRKRRPLIQVCRLLSRIAPAAAVFFLLSIADIFISEYGYSVIQRYLDLAPLLLAFPAFLLVITGLAGSYYLSHRQEQELASRDIVPIL